MSWFPWRRPSPAPPVTPPPVEADEPEPPRSTLLERIAKWRAYYAAERQTEASAEQIERAREAQRARAAEAAEDEIARSIARRGVHWPGESADDDGPSTSGGGLWFRW
jgi:hypothetical protein